MSEDGPTHRLKVEPGILTLTGVSVGMEVKRAEIFGEVALSLSAIILPVEKSHQGTLIKAAGLAWTAIARELGNNWHRAYEIHYATWEEIIAGAFDKAGYDEVTLTPRSGDHGRDVIAIRKGVGCVKIIGSVKAYKPGHLVSYEHVRALAGVLSLEQDASKGIITTTTDFPPKIESDPLIARVRPWRLELMNGEALQKWLAELAASS